MSYESIMFKSVAVSGSGDNTAIAAVTGKAIRVLSYTLVCAAAVTVAFQSGASGTALTGTMSFAANGGVSSGYNPQGHFQTAPGALLNISLGGAQSVAGHITYVLV